MEIVTGGTVSGLLKDTPIPKMFHARQTFPQEKILPEQIPEVISQQLEQEQFASLIQPGMEIKQKIREVHTSNMLWFVP